MEAGLRIKLLPGLRKEPSPPFFPLGPDISSNLNNNSPCDEECSKMDTDVERGMRNAIWQEKFESTEMINILQRYRDQFGKYSCLDDDDLLRIVAKTFMDCPLELLSKLDDFSAKQMKDDIYYEFNYSKRQKHESPLHSGLWILAEKNPNKVTWNKVFDALEKLEKYGTIDLLLDSKNMELWKKLEVINCDKNKCKKQPVESITPEENVREFSTPVRNQQQSSRIGNNYNTPDSGFETGEHNHANRHHFSERSPYTQAYAGSFQPTYNNNQFCLPNLPNSLRTDNHLQDTRMLPQRTENNPVVDFSGDAGFSNFVEHGNNFSNRFLMPTSPPTRSTVSPQITLVPRESRPCVLITHSFDAINEATSLARNLFYKGRIVAVTLKNIIDSPDACTFQRVLQEAVLYIPVISPMYIMDIDYSQVLPFDVVQKLKCMEYDCLLSNYVKRVHTEMDIRYTQDRCKNTFIRPVHLPSITPAMKFRLSPFLLNSRKIWDDQDEFINNLLR